MRIIFWCRSTVSFLWYVLVHTGRFYGPTGQLGRIAGGSVTAENISRDHDELRQKGFQLYRLVSLSITISLNNEHHEYLNPKFEGK